MAAELSESAGQAIIDGVKGHFRNYKVSGTDINTFAYVFEEDKVWEIGNYPHSLQLFLWKDSILVLKKD